MASYSSPFHTLHDTIGASTLVTPLVMPSSPPSLTRDDEEEPGTPDSPVPKSTTPRRDARDTRRENELDGEDDEEDDDRYFARQRDFDSPVLSRASSPDHSGVDINARLAEYSIDFSRLPGATLSGDGEDEFLSEMKGPEVEKLSDVGGPEDFTANLERYLMGDDDDDHHYNEQDTPLRRQLQNDLEASIRKDQEQEYAQKKNQEKEADEDEDEDEDGEEEHKLPEQTDLHQQQNSSTGNEQELGEYSEFGPPIDMSTPSHFLRRSNSGHVTQLEDIEEDDDEIDEAATPSKVLSTKGDEKDLHRQIAELQKAVKDRDEQIQKNHQQVLEGASAAEQNKHLQAEIQEKTAFLDSLRAEKDHENHSSFQRSENAADMSGIQRQMAEMQKELQNRNSQTDLDTERLETIAHLRQQLGGVQEQLKKRDETLDETVAKLREAITAKEKQLEEKNAEIDGLRTRVDDQALDIEKLETDVDQANTDYQTLQGRISTLETKNRPLEEKNSTLEADLTRAQSQVTAQENALKAMAADLPTGNGGQKTFAEILDLIKDLGPPSPTEEPAFLAPPPPGFPTANNAKMDEEGRLRQELSKLQAEMNVRSQVQRTLEVELSRAREQTTETQSLLKSIEDENARLSRQLKDSKSTADKAQRDLDQLRTEHTSAFQKIELLQDDQNKIQQPSPPPSPPTARNTRQQGSSPRGAAHTTTAQQDANHHYSHLQQLLAQAEKRESRLRAEIQSLRASRPSQDARVQLQTLTAEIERLEATIAAKDETAADMDAQIARSVEKREKEWERRVELLLKERERMSRALMWAWGEKEVGEKSKANVYTEDGKKIRQGYRYKYVSPSSNGAKSGKKTSS